MRPGRLAGHPLALWPDVVCKATVASQIHSLGEHRRRKRQPWTCPRGPHSLVEEARRDYTEGPVPQGQAKEHLAYPGVQQETSLRG